MSPKRNATIMYYFQIMALIII